MTYVVLAKDLREGDDFIVGPFETATLAYKWASDDADEKATAYGMKAGLDADGEGYLSLSEGGNAPDEMFDMVYEWQVMETIRPTDKYVRFLTGDDLREGAQPGWYLFPKGDDGDSTGPFDTKEEAEKQRQT